MSKEEITQADTQNENNAGRASDSVYWARCGNAQPG